MNGAEALIQTLCNNGIEVCFANPGTSEMQFVAAIDQQPSMRTVLGLFEGVVTGAADGYGRMAGKPAVTLLHLGPGLANGCANLHNARRAYSPIINIVGDHATHHLKFDSPLTSDVEKIAFPVSDWVNTSTSAANLSELGTLAIKAASAYPGQVATLIAPADHAWEAVESCAAPTVKLPPQQVTDDIVRVAAEVLKNKGASALFLGGMALHEQELEQAGRIAAATGARLICETFPARLLRGEACVAVERLPYFGETAAELLKDFSQIIIVGSKPPVSFFAYPGKPSWLTSDRTNLVTLADPHENALNALRRLADVLGAPKEPTQRQPRTIPPIIQGKLTPQGVGAVLAELMPENAIISDESATSGFAIFPMTQGAAKHDWMTLTGGSIGQGLPLGVGAAIACPNRKVICLQADGSAMYTVQALWTMARENLDITTIILNNGSYAILNIELQRLGVTEPGSKALSLLDLTKPAIDWVSISKGMGISAKRAETVEDFHEILSEALIQKGPYLIEAIINP